MNPYADLSEPINNVASVRPNDTSYGAQLAQGDAQGSYLASWNRYKQLSTDKAEIDANLNLQEVDETAARNEATAARQNQQAFQQRQNPRAGGSRYTRRGLWKAGGSGLNLANAKAKTEARRQLAYAQKAKEYAAQNAPGATSIKPLGISVYA